MMNNETRNEIRNSANARAVSRRRDLENQCLAWLRVAMHATSQPGARELALALSEAHADAAEHCTIDAMSVG